MSSASATVSPLVLCGPSGSGKSTIMKKLTAEFPDAFGFSVSHTTRKPRPGEEDGVHYHFVERASMEAAIAAGDFIEHAEFSGNMYGTSKKAVSDVLAADKICILDIEMKGVKQIKALPEFRPLYVIMKPPSMEELERRLRDRGTESEESLAKRLAVARSEMEDPTIDAHFDIVIVNDDLERAYQQLRAFVLPEIEKQKKQ